MSGNHSGEHTLILDADAGAVDPKTSLVIPNLLLYWLVHFKISTNINSECCTHAYFAYHLDAETHLIDNSFANTQAETSSRWINLLMLLEFSKINKQLT